jgi:voltage-gated potassium channel
MATSTDPRTPDAAALSALGQIARGLMAAPGGELSYGSLKRGLREAMTRDPIDSLATVVLGGSYLFYLAEKGRNPKVNSFWDALTFITTCLSVGYHDVFARTDAGKAIASFVMTFGPSLSGAALDPPAREETAPKADPEALAVQREIAAKLDAILDALRDKAPEARAAAPTAPTTPTAPPAASPDKPPAA